MIRIRLYILVLVSITTEIVTITSSHKTKFREENYSKNLRKVNDKIIRTLIINGQGARKDLYPWFVSGRGGCGGSLISSQFVLTAAHCVPHFHSLSIGPLCYQNLNNCGQKTERFDAEDSFIHPFYNNSTARYDLALIKLDGRSHIEPVKLDKDGISLSYEEGKKLWVAGFGDTDADERGANPDHLMHVIVQYIPNQKCAILINNSLSFDEGEMCAAADHQGPCNGDSGGPLYDVDNHILVGVVSRGTRPCAQGNKPSIYSRLAVEWNFIKDVVCDNSSGDLPFFCGNIRNSTIDPKFEIDA